MGCLAILTKVNDKARTRLKLSTWTSEDPDEIINDVVNGNRRKITDFDCGACKDDLEEYDAAEVKVEQN